MRCSFVLDEVAAAVGEVPNGGQTLTHHIARVAAETDAASFPSAAAARRAIVHRLLANEALRRDVLLRLLDDPELHVLARKRVTMPALPPGRTEDHGGEDVTVLDPEGEPIVLDNLKLSSAAGRIPSDVEVNPATGTQWGRW